jgi:Fur family ferric uptake transcriptional regulator
MTQQRQLILEQLQKRSDHPGADEVYDKVREFLPKISLGTVYRNLELLSEAGYIQKLFFKGQKRFDPRTDQHHHFCCTNCGKVEDIPFPIDTPDIDSGSDWLKQREIQEVHLHYLGLCPDCKQSQ